MQRRTELSPPPPARSQAARSQAVLQRFARLPPLIEPGSGDIEASVQRLAEVLSTSGESATLSLHLVGVAGIQRWHVRVEPKGATAGKGGAEGPNLELVTSPGAWLEIASGELSPLSAFGAGRLRVRGDIALGRRLLRHTATAPDAVVDFC
jgi:putative sterol carrier protein